MADDENKSFFTAADEAAHELKEKHQGSKDQEKMKEEAKQEAADDKKRHEENKRQGML